MRRHVLIGHFGSADNVKIAVAPDETSTRFNLLLPDRELGHGIRRALTDLAKLGALPSELGIDLLVLAAHVYAADTRISRNTESQDSWTREIRIVVPVSDASRWTANAALLKTTLDFLTGDRWIVDFRPRTRGFSTLRPVLPAKAPKPNYDCISLFSGGLDSLIGGIDLLEAGATPLFVSHAGEGATSSAQYDCFDPITQHYVNQLPDRLRVWMSFSKNLIQDAGLENTTRGRSFLFFALGAFAGTALKKPFKLFVPENGLIALNVPLDPLRLGSLSTRTTHPFYIARWNELLNGLGIPGSIENPYWNRTKGEMVANCRNKPLLRKLVPNSLSCSSPTKARWKGHAIEHCGYCLPCLIRRAAIQKGLGAADPTTYTIPNLAAKPLDATTAEGQQVRSFQVAIDRLTSHPELAKLLIYKPGPLRDESAARQKELAQVYQRGMAEVGGLLLGVRTRST